MINEVYGNLVRTINEVNVNIEQVLKDISKKHINDLLESRKDKTMKYIVEIEPLEGTNYYMLMGNNILVDQKYIDNYCTPLEEEQKCPFEKDELVEVSDDGICWNIRHFVQMEDGKYACTENGYTSKERKTVIRWLYCQKYGTLGDLIKE